MGCLPAGSRIRKNRILGIIESLILDFLPCTGRAPDGELSNG